MSGAAVAMGLVVSKEKLLEALKRERADKALLMSFLIGASKEGGRLEQRRAAEAAAAACRLLRISAEDYAALTG